MTRGEGSSSFISNFVRPYAQGAKVSSLPLSVDLASLFRRSPPSRVLVPTPPLSLHTYISLSLALPSLSREIKRHVEATWTRPADKCVAGDISRHLRARPSTLPWRYIPLPSPLHHHRPLTLLTPPTPGFSFSRSRERVLAHTSGETRLSVSRGEQGLGGRERLFTYFHSRDLVRA